MIIRMNCISRIRVQVGSRTSQVHRPICRDGRRSNGAAVLPTGLGEKIVTKIPVNIEALLSF